MPHFAKECGICLLINKRFKEQIPVTIEINSFAQDYF